MQFNNSSIELFGMPTILILFICAELFTISIFDFKNRKIPNFWHLINVVLFLFFINSNPEIYSISIRTIVPSLLVIILGIILFKFKIMGAGDSKLLASLLILIPISSQSEFIESILYGTLFVAAPRFLYNCLRNWKKISMSIILKESIFIKGTFGDKIPFAPIILISWILFLCTKVVSF